MASANLCQSQASPARTDGGDLVESPVFLVGSERSGSTLFRLMLDHHPQIAFFFEFDYSVLAMPEGTGWPDLEDYYEYLENDRIFRAARLEIDRSLDYPHLVDSFLRQKRRRDGKSLVGATVHHDFDRLTRIWPDARFIHIVRDGRDVARSVITNGLAGNLWTAAETWVRAESMWSQMAAKLPPERFIEVRYEDLSSRAEEVLQETCRFIGVPYDPAMFNYVGKTTYDRPSTARIYLWKSKMTPWETRLAETRMGSLLAERGYELSGLPPLEITPMLRSKLRIQDRLYRAAFRRRIYGTKLWLADLLARRFGTRRMQLALKRRIDDIDDQNVK